MENCIFCQIASHQIAAKIIFENENILVFEDIHPKAPVHLLMIPKDHLSNLTEINPENIDLIKELFIFLPDICKKIGISDDGFRIIINTKNNGGQEVDHLHIHLIGGHKLPPMICNH